MVTTPSRLHPAPKPRSGRYEEYHPYGSTAWWTFDSATQVSQKRYRYAGKEKDDQTGFSYHGARYYASWLGRWTSADPIGIGDGVNRFGYVHGNPIGGSDPTGMGDEDQVSPFSAEYWNSGQWKVDMESALTEWHPLNAISGPISDALEGNPPTEGELRDAIGETLERTAAVPWIIGGLAGIGIVPRGSVSPSAVGGALRNISPELRASAARVASRQLGEAAVRGAAEHILPGRVNPGGATRSLAQALEIAESAGIEFAGYDVRLVLDPSLTARGTAAEYLRSTQFYSTERVSLETVGFRANAEGGYTAYVRVAPETLASDEQIVNALAHEAHELNWLYERIRFGDRPLGGEELRNAIDIGGSGVLGAVHRKALDVGNRAMLQYRALLAAVSR